MAPETPDHLADERSWSSLPDRFDFIFSEDVFEHVSVEELERIVELIAERMDSRSIVIVTPMVFTGISGGHELGWYTHLVDRDGVARGP
ncbi:hypothetical protein, partial [Rhodoplanes sp. SY1]|uniref:hypothetical protein n=1 Tax=Rhodoplanes sp. SY1 TaxID=3166646 RepID=UPI0038B4A0A4